VVGFIVKILVLTGNIAMKWIIPSAPWAAEMRLIMESLGICMNDAFKLLNEHGTAEAVFDHVTS
jgi:hypothetical protein